MAWAEKLASGKYRGCWRDSDGRKQYTNRKTHPQHPYERKRDAKAAAAEAEVKAQRQAAAETGTLSAGTHWGEWWDLIKHKRIKLDVDTHVVEFKLAERYLRPHWAEEPLNGIKHRLVQHWIDELTLGRAPEWQRDRPPEPSTIHRIYDVFRWSITHALDEQVLDASPCVGIKLPKIRKKRRPYIAELSPKLGEQLGESRDAVDFDLETGLRPNELCGLHADHIDLRRGDHGVVEVSEVLVNGRRVIRAFPKDKDARVVPLTAKAREIIDRQLEGRDLKQGCGLPHTDGTSCMSPLVFLNSQGRPMTADFLRTKMRRAARDAALPHRSPYSVRRGYATRLADGGADAFQIARMMGHETLEQAAEYVQETPTAHRRVLAALGERQPLSVVEGQAGAEPGAHSDPQSRPDTPIDEQESVG